MESEFDGYVLKKEQGLRYGENPHQKANFFLDLNLSDKQWSQLNGKELSYNNLLDLDAALKLNRAFPNKPAMAAIIKHLNPCGAALSDNLLGALRQAKRCDPRSHFGGIIALNGCVNEIVAQEVSEDFAELIIAPDYTEQALSILKSRKNLRVIRVKSDTQDSTYDIRSAAGGVLIQTSDLEISRAITADRVADKAPSEMELADLDFAWRVCAHTKSNAIVIANGGMLAGVGAGQTSRIDATELAISKAKRHGHSLRGAVAASDAFFPFPDCLESLAEQGVTAIISPAGSKSDSDVIAAAKRLNLCLLFARDRHFRH